MPLTTAFAPALALPLRSARRSTCRVTRPRVAMRVVRDVDRAHDDLVPDDMREDAGEAHLVGGAVPPADFDDVQQAQGSTKGAEGVAGIAGEDDLLVDIADGGKKGTLGGKMEAKAVEIPKSVEVSEESPVEEDKREVKAAEASKPIEKKRKVQDVQPDLKKEPTAVEEIASEAKPAAPARTSIKMSPEQIEKAKAARAAATKAAEETEARKKEQAKELLSKAEGLLKKIGSKSRAFELGETARSKAEEFVESTITAGQAKDASQQDKLKGSAASAAKSIVAAVTKGWEEKAVPQIRERLPSEYGGVSNKAFASAAVGLFIAIALLPSLFSGGGEKPKEPQKKKLDAETAMLERKLQRERSALSSYGSKSAAQKAVFPPEEEKPAPKRSAPGAPTKVAPTTPKTAETEKPAPTTVPPTGLSAVPKPETPPATPAPPVTPPAPPKAVVEPPKPKAPEPVKPADATPTMVMASVTKALGSNAGLVSSASFDSLAPEPTVVLQVSQAYHKLPAVEQKRLAQTMLQSARTLGYERVSLIEVGTGMEVAHAGLDVDLEDEAENLRAEVASLRKLSDKLAIQAANNEAEIDKLNARLAEERDESAVKRVELEKSIESLRAENSGLLDDLAEAKAEISKMPDRLALEDRTLEAERKTEKMGDTVEMLSMQLSKARNEEALAKKVESEAVASAQAANKAKEDALASVASQIEQAQKAAENRADERIAAVQKEASASAEAADMRVKGIEDRLALTQKEAESTLGETKQRYEKQLNDQKTSSEQEVQTIQQKYEAKLEEVQRKAQAELDAFQKEADRKMAATLKEGKALTNSLMKERDQAMKETEKSEARGQKAADKAEREKQGLQKRIERLEAKLKGKEPAQEKSEAAGVVAPSS